MIQKRFLIAAACSLAVFASVLAPAARAWSPPPTPTAPSHPIDYPNDPPIDTYTGEPDPGAGGLVMLLKDIAEETYGLISRAWWSGSLHPARQISARTGRSSNRGGLGQTRGSR